MIFCLDADNVLSPNSVPNLKEFMLLKKADAAAFGELHFFIKNTKNPTHKWIYNNVSTIYDTINNIQKTPCASGNYLFTKLSWIRAGRYIEARSLIIIDSWLFSFCQLVTGSNIITMPNSYYYHRYGYESTYVRESKKYNQSIMMLQIFLPYLDMFNDKDIDYIMSRKGRYSWFENIKKHPVKLKI